MPSSQGARFNGNLQGAQCLPLGREEIGELCEAAVDWREVEPAIFGTLLEQALDPAERQRLGAHYTPRAYVERLVVATIIEPLREDWARVLATAERQKREARDKDAIADPSRFHDKLCETRVLDPACGTGNSSMSSLELMKRLEGEVLEALVDLGGQEALAGLRATPSIRTSSSAWRSIRAPRRSPNWCCGSAICNGMSARKAALPSEPILRAFRNIVVKDAVLGAERTLVRDGTGKPLRGPGRMVTGDRPLPRIRAGPSGPRRSSSSATRRSSAARTCARGSATNTRRRCGRPTRR